MLKRIIGFAAIFAAVVGMSTVAQAQAKTKPATEAEVCMEFVKDTLDARAANPVIGPKATAEFEKLVAEAEASCKTGKTAQAMKDLVTARGMVASE